MLNKFHRDLLRRLREAGITVDGFEQRSGSIALMCSRGNRKLKYFLGITPSDSRAMDNAFHDIKRVLVPTKEASNAD